MQSTLKQGRLIKIKTPELYDFALAKNIEIICTELPHTKSVSILSLNGNCYIGIDPFEIETEAEERVHLAHELGHCEKGAFYNAYSKLDIRARHEIRADRWAILKLIPYEEFHAVLELGLTEPWELAEHFNVTEEFILKAITYHQNISTHH